MLNRRHTLLGMGAIVALAATPVAASDGPLTVVATTGMIADAARQIGAAEVEVTALMGAGVDPHAYRQTRSDIAAMTRADLVLWHGLYLEAQMEDFFHSLARKREVVAVAEAMVAEAFTIGHERIAREVAARHDAEELAAHEAAARQAASWMLWSAWRQLMLRTRKRRRWIFHLIQ